MVHPGQTVVSCGTTDDTCIHLDNTGTIWDMSSQLPGDTARELRTALGRKPDVLSVGHSSEVRLVALRTALALRELGEWQVWGWESIATGSWRAESKTFRWSTTAGEKYEVQLDEVDRLPEVFQERVQASTVLTESHDLVRGRIEIIGRRTLDGTNKTSWYATAGGGASLADPETAALVVERTDALKAEYGLS